LSKKVSEKGDRESPGESDRALIRRVQAGDGDAFEVLVVKYQERIFRLIRRLLRNPDQVEDLAQEVFIRAYRSLGSFKGEASFYTWLYKIALNSCRNYYRSLGRRPEGSVVDNESVLTNRASAGYSPEREAVRSEFWRSVRGSLEELPEEQREAVVLCDLEGMSYDEMAAVIGIPVGTVRSRVFRGRRSLQRKLKPYLEGTKVNSEEGTH
jgi:RNA polymerase sigma-70 factor (ECF subfamily)